MGQKAVKLSIFLVADYLVEAGGFGATLFLAYDRRSKLCRGQEDFRGQARSRLNQCKLLLLGDYAKILTYFFHET